MDSYYLNKSTSEIHKLHSINEEKCNVDSFILGFNKDNFLCLGEFLNSEDAILKAISLGYSNADGCKYCNEKTHTK